MINTSLSLPLPLSTKCFLGAHIEPFGIQARLENWRCQTKPNTSKSAAFMQDIFKFGRN